MRHFAFSKVSQRYRKFSLWRLRPYRYNINAWNQENDPTIRTACQQQEFEQNRNTVLQKLKKKRIDLEVKHIEIRYICINSKYSILILIK